MTSLARVHNLSISLDGFPKSYRLDLVSSTASKNGIVELQYRRHR